MKGSYARWEYRMAGREKLTVDKPIIVEGRYDKEKIASVVNGVIITTEGFGIFSRSEKLALIRRMAQSGGIILLTDSDGAGGVIRSYITSSVPAGSVTQLYIPAVKGKEKRKKSPSKAGTLGVEGIDADKLYSLLLPFSREYEDTSPRGGITKADMYAAGMSGGDDAQSRRDKMAARLELPPGMTANALLSAMNVLLSHDEFEMIISELF